MANPRYSNRLSDHWEYSLWLVFDDSGGVRMSRGEPALSRNERAVALTAKLPLSLWKTPQLQATLTVASDPAGATVQLDVRAVEQALRSAIGCDVDIVVREVPQENG